MKASKIIFALILVNAAGLTLRYFNFDTYFIFLGFRFHISCVIPFLFLLRFEILDDVKNYFRHPGYKFYYTPLLKIILPLIFLTAILYILKLIRFCDPEYFYEFGLSSIVDYPLYLIWNTPELILLFLFLSASVSRKSNRFLIVTVLLILLYTFEMIPIGQYHFYFSDYLSFIILILIGSVLFENYNNIILFPVLLFTVLWSVLLFFGSASSGLINILFAARYSGWEGFFEASGNFEPFLIPGYFAVILFCLSFKRRIYNKLS